MLYQEASSIDEIKEVSRRIRELMKDDNYSYSFIYADICLRCLDGFHTKEEAAYHYLMAANRGDGDCDSYLNSIDKSLIDENVAFDLKVEILVNYWNSFN